MSLIKFNNPFFIGGEIINPRITAFPLEQVAKENDSEIEIDGVITKIWCKAEVDLARLSQFKINNDLIYSVKAGIAIPSMEEIFKTILAKCDGDWSEAKKYINLLEQSTQHLGHYEVFTKFGILDTKLLKMIDKLSTLHIFGKCFNINCEMLIKVINQDDPEETKPQDTFYMKIKVLIEGKRTSLTSGQERKIEPLRARILYTSSSSTQIQAEAKRYGSPWNRFTEDAKSEMYTQTT